MTRSEDVPAWRTWTGKDWVSAVLIVLAGYVVARVLPDGWFSTLGFVAYIGFFVIVWWKRRAVRPPVPDQDWAPPERNPGSDS